MGVGDGRGVGPGREHGEVDGQVRRRGEAGWRPLRALVVAEPQLDQVVRPELVLAPAGRGDQQTGIVETDGQVALGGGDQPARAEPSPALEQRLPGRLQVHPAMLRGVTPPSSGQAAMSSCRAGAGSALSSTTTWQSSQRTSVRSGWMVAGPAHQGQSVVMSFAPSLGFDGASLDAGRDS